MTLGGDADLVADWITPDSFVIDIGANVGLFTTWAQSKGARVVAIEPYPPNIRILELVAPSATLLRVALGPFDGECGFLVPDTECPVGGFLVPGSGTPMISWETFRSSYPEEVDVLKVDIEGGEYDILPSADLSGIRHFVIENHAWTTPLQPRIDGVGVRSGKAMEKGCYEQLLTSLERRHSLTLYGDWRGGHIVGVER